MSRYYTRYVLYAIVCVVAAWSVLALLIAAAHLPHRTPLPHEPWQSKFNCAPPERQHHCGPFYPQT